MTERTMWSTERTSNKEILMLSRIWKRVDEVANDLSVIGAILMTLVCFMYIVKLVMEVMWPVTTLLFVLFFTVYSCENRTARWISWSGIGVYLLSFLVGMQYGDWPAVLVCLAGVLTWMYAIMYRFEHGKPPIKWDQLLVA